MSGFDAYDGWLMAPLYERDAKEKRRFEDKSQLDADVKDYVSQEIVDEIRLGGVEMIDWVIDSVFGGEDEFKKAIAERFKESDPMYREIEAEYFENIEPFFCPVD